MRKFLATLAALLVGSTLAGCGYNTLQRNDEQIAKPPVVDFASAPPQSAGAPK